MSDYSIASFQKFSAITPDMVVQLKGMHPMCLWLANPFFAQKEFQEGLNVVYNVDKDGKPTKYTRIVERVMQCVTDKTTMFAEPFLSMKNSLRNTFTFPSERTFKRFDPNRTVHTAQLAALFEENRQKHLMMEMLASMQRPKHGEKTVFFFSLEEALDARELFHCLEMVKNVDPRDKWGRWLCSCRDGHQSRCCSHSIILSMMMWPEECQLVFFDDGFLLPPCKKNKRKKDGTFRSDKSK